MPLTLSGSPIYIASDPVDFRKSINGLSAIVVEQFSQKPTEGIYIFYNRARNKVKCLFWHGNGFVMVYKCLSQGKFHVAYNGTGLVLIDERQLEWLLAGLDWSLMSDWKKQITYEDYF